MASKVERAVIGDITLSPKHGEVLTAKELVDTYPVCGLDIEADSTTAEPFLLGIDGEESSGIYTIESWNDCVSALTADRLRKTINFFYNLQYDFEGMCRFLGQEVAIRLLSGEVVGTDWAGNIVKDNPKVRMKYVPRKAFTLQVGKSTWRYFDLWQYYLMSLAAAVKANIPGEAKGEFDAAESSIERYRNDWTYRREIQRYCLHDAYLARRLGEIIVSGANRFVNTREFYSSAGVSEKYFRSLGFRIPSVPKSVMKAFMKCYHGGRFEMVKRGTFSGASLIDIKSAYPYAMTKMPILDDTFKVRLGKERDYDALYGAYEIETSIPEDWYLSPLARKITGTLCFPVGDYESEWASAITLDLLDNLGIDYRIIQGYELHQSEYEYSLAEPIRGLFAVKEDKSNPPGMRYAAKINMNGLYGKLIQLVDDVVIEEVKTLEEIDGLDYGELISLYDKWFKRVHTGNFKTGALYAPWYADFVTSYTRKQMFEMSLNVGPKNVITLHTDSLALLGNPPETGTGLGEWELETLKGQDLKDCLLRISKCGFYEVEKGGVKKIRSRGVGKTDSIVKESYTVKRRYGMNQAIRKDYGRMNVISEVELRQNLNADKKRIWDKDLTASVFDVGEWIDSKPIRIERLSYPNTTLIEA